MAAGIEKATVAVPRDETTSSLLMIFEEFAVANHEIVTSSPGTYPRSVTVTRLPTAPDRALSVVRALTTTASFTFVPLVSPTTQTSWAPPGDSGIFTLPDPDPPASAVKVPSGDRVGRSHVTRMRSPSLKPVQLTTNNVSYDAVAAEAVHAAGSLVAVELGSGDGGIVFVPAGSEDAVSVPRVSGVDVPVADALGVGVPVAVHVLVGDGVTEPVMVGVTVRAPETAA